jgi:hypothetical protein
LDATGVNGADGDYDGDGLTNLAEFLAGTDPTDPDITPPSITPALQPVANAFGWHNTNVVVSFVATDTESGVAFVTGDVTLSTETNDAEVVGIAMDNAGNSSTNSAFVSIDLTPPELTLDPGHGDTFDDSHPLLIVEYSDQPSAAGAQPAGLNLETLSVTLDGVSITNQFHRFASRAVATITNLNAGTHTWSASIRDYAGNVTSTTVVFTATGTVNTNAPVLSELSLGDGVTVLPDMAEVWVACRVSGANVTGSVSVNGGDGLALNVAGGKAWRVVPLDYGTNVVVLSVQDADGNVASKLLRVERSQRYVLTVDDLGSAIGPGDGQRIRGQVSQTLDAGTSHAATLVSMSINGYACEVPAGTGNATYATPENFPEPLPGEWVLLVATLTWSDGQVFTVPVRELEGYRLREVEQEMYTERTKFQEGWDPCSSTEFLAQGMWTSAELI